MTAQELLRSISEADENFDGAYDKYVLLSTAHTDDGLLALSKATRADEVLKAMRELDEIQIAVVVAVIGAGAASLSARVLRARAREIESRC